MKSFLFLAIAVTSALTTQTVTGAELRVMSFNLWHGGNAGKQPLSQTAEVIRAAKADIIGLQETGGYEKEKGSGRPDNGRKLAEILGWHYFDQGERTGILSRFPIITNTARKWGVTIRVAPGREVMMFNVHLAHAPYQPYQLAGIPYANGRFIKTAAEAVDEARKARGEQVGRLLAELKPALAGAQPVFVTGDFNEPSPLDWTARAAAAGHHPVAVDYPSALAVLQAGMRDAYRTAHPDELTHPGHTWTPTTRPDDPKDRHDRIDFVFFAGSNMTVKRCDVVGEDKKFADILVQPYPSDHRAVVATIEWPD